MIRDDRQASLDETIVGLQEEAARLRDAAERIADTDPDLAQLLHTQAQQYEIYATRLKPGMQALNDLPSEPDQEHEILESLVSRVHAAFSGDPRNTVLSERLQGAQRLLDCLERALQSQPPPPILDELQSVRDYLRAARDRLQSLTAV